MAENTTRQTDHLREQNVKKGSAIFFRLPPTFMITELITLLFYPAFFSVVGNMWLADGAGQIVGGGAGVVLAVVAISFRRLGQRWASSQITNREKQAADDVLDEAGEIPPHNNMHLLAEQFYILT